jgi:uncharacterized protein YbjT (DUF2867 family)
MSELDRKPTLVMGARGSIGQHVLDELIARGVPVRASARHPRPGQFPAGVEVHAADLTDPATLVPAFHGVGRAFLYAHRHGVRDLISVASAAGVRRIVLVSSGSVIHPTSKGNAITEAHREVEQAFADAPALTVIPIRPLVLATNALGWARAIRTDGAVSLYQPDAVTAPIHERDVAAVAVAALTGNDDTTGLLTGPAPISQRDQVAAIGAATARDIAVTALTREDALTRYSHFMPAQEAEAVLRFLDDAAAGNSPATSTVARILRRPALPFATWATDHAADFTPDRVGW